MSETIMNGKKIKLFTLSANKTLAREISEYVNIPLSKIDSTRFADGEMNISFEESVRGSHVFVVQPTSAPVNEHYMELFIFIDALKRSSASEITVIMPYYGYSRQDKKTKSRQPITAKLIADLLQTAGVDRLIGIDLHAQQIQGFFDIPMDNFSAARVIADYVSKKDMDNMVIVSPDHGGAARARHLTKMLGDENIPIAIIDKRRPRPNVAEALNVIGDVNGKDCVIIDDIIDTAGTLVAAADVLVKHGAKSVIACATHPLFSNDALEKIEKSVLKEVVVTNTIELDKSKLPKKVTQLSMGNVLGQALLNIINDRSVSPVFEREIK